MFCDIAPICNDYRGIERVVDVFNFNKKGRKKYKEIIENYFNYIEWSPILSSFSKQQVSKMIEFAKYFSENSSDTYEVIIYSESQICESFGHEFLFLGIDVIDIDADSILLELNLQPILKDIKNNFGLLNSVDDIEKIRNLDAIAEYGELRYVWVYSILN